MEECVEFLPGWGVVVAQHCAGAPGEPAGRFVAAGGGKTVQRGQKDRDQIVASRPARSSFCDIAAHQPSPGATPRFSLAAALIIWGRQGGS